MIMIFGFLLALISSSWAISIPNGNSKFSTSLNCTLTESKCNEFKTIIDQVHDSFSQVFVIKDNIHVQVNIQKFPDSYFSALVLPAKVKGYLENDQDQYPVYYPQALAKQFEWKYDKTNLSETDIYVFINGDDDFYFPGLTNQSITEDQKDFFGIYFHEFLHSTGLFSSLYNPKNTTLVIPDIINPQPNELFQFITGDPNTLITNFYGPFIYDKFLETSKGIKLSNLIQKVMEYKISDKGIMRNDFLEKIKKDQKVYQAAQELDKLTVSNETILFKGLNGSYDLFTDPQKFLSGSSLIHLSDRYNSSADYIMVYYATNGVNFQETVKAKLPKNWKYGLFGPITLDIFKTLGWNTYDDEKFQTFIRVTDEKFDWKELEKNRKSKSNSFSKLCQLLLMSNPGLSLTLCN